MSAAGSATAQQVEAVERLVLDSVRAVDALAPTVLGEVYPALRAARDELRRDLQRWLADTPGGSERFTAYQREQALRALEASMERVAELEPAVARGLALSRHTTGPLAVANLDGEIRRLSAIFGGGIPTIPQIDTAAVIARGDRMLWRRHATSARRYAGAVGDDIRHLLAVGVAKGETFEQLVTRLRKLGDPRARREPINPGGDADVIASGLFQRYKHTADRLVRTEMMNAYNVQHDGAIEYANENRPEGEDPYLRRWDASADKVVCERCKALHRTVATMDGTFRFGIKAPPAHPYCRCVVLAWLARWGDMRGETSIRGRIPKEHPHRPKGPTRDRKLPPGQPPVPPPPRAPRTHTVGPSPQNPTRKPATLTSRMLRRPGKRGVDTISTNLAPPPPRAAPPAPPPPPPKPARAAKPKPVKLSPLEKARATEAAEQAQIAQLEAQPRRVLAAIRAGDYETTQHEIKSMIAARGYTETALPPGVVRARQTISVSDDGMETTNHSGERITARAFHGWDHRTQLSTKVEGELRTLAGLGIDLHLEESLGVLERKAAVLRQTEYSMRARTRSKAARAKVMPEVTAMQTEAQAAADRAMKIGQGTNGLRTFIHEEVHGYSPINASAYRLAGGKIEEVTTETTARVMLRDHFGGRIASWDAGVGQSIRNMAQGKIGDEVGSYAEDIKATVTAMAEASGRSMDDSWEALQRTSHRFRRRTTKIVSAEEALLRFAEDAAHETGSPVRAMEAALRRHLGPTF